MSLLTPVRYPVKYYKWDDGQAPQLTDADGVIKTILKACLVTGYGDKAGAGWTARFEDDSRIVLRRPLQIGNPPDIKIENGVVNGQGSHRIVLQNNPSGLDDANELDIAGIITRDEYYQPQWHLVATDFAFVFFYHMSHGNRRHEPIATMVYVGGIRSLDSNKQEVFMVTDHNSNKVTGKEIAWSYPFLNTNSRYKATTKIATNVMDNKLFHTLNYSIDNDRHIIQSIILQRISALMPFYCELTSVNGMLKKLAPTKLNIMGRPMFRIANIVAVNAPVPAFYIPLDYWEL